MSKILLKDPQDRCQWLIDPNASIERVKEMKADIKERLKTAKSDIAIIDFYLISLECERFLKEKELNEKQ